MLNYGNKEAVKRTKKKEKLSYTFPGGIKHLKISPRTKRIGGGGELQKFLARVSNLNLKTFDLRMRKKNKISTFLFLFIYLFMKTKQKFSLLLLISGMDQRRREEGETGFLFFFFARDRHLRHGS